MINKVFEVALTKSGIGNPKIRYVIYGYTHYVTIGYSTLRACDTFNDFVDANNININSQSDICLFDGLDVDSLEKDLIKHDCVAILTNNVNTNIKSAAHWTNKPTVKVDEFANVINTFAGDNRAKKVLQMKSIVTKNIAFEHKWSRQTKLLPEFLNDI